MRTIRSCAAGQEALCQHDEVNDLRDYEDWHRHYEDPGSDLSWRLAQVREYVQEAFDRHPGQIRALNVCAGDGRDVLGVLAERADADRVSTVLLELHPALAQLARDAAISAQLPDVEVRMLDAGVSNAYLGAVPADVVLLVGIFGNIRDEDLWRLVAFAPQLCRPGATLIWSRGRSFSRALPGVTEDLNDELRGQFAATGFTETAYVTRDTGSRPALGVVRYSGEPVDLALEHQLFSFVR